MTFFERLVAAMGVSAAKHGVTGNGRTKLGSYAAWPMWLTRDGEGVVYVADFGGNLTSFSIRS